MSEDRLDGSSVFFFSDAQLDELRTARLASAIFSVSFDLVAVIIFVYLVAYHRAQVNRPSTRCAFCCCVANLVENVLFVALLQTAGPSIFCTTATFIAQYMAILNVTYLTLIGINLVLVYVINIRRRHTLEYYYHPCSLVYACVGLVGPIVRYCKMGAQNEEVALAQSCWDITVMKDRIDADIGYMWFYGFIFFATVIAFICSGVAIVKILMDKRVISKQPKSKEGAATKPQLQVFSQAIVRCLLYPIVPLISNFCGFLQQCIITRPNARPGFSLTMASTILHGLGGFFVALIFLNDPMLMQVLSGWYDHWYHKHVMEYVLVESNGDDYLKVLDYRKENNDSQNADPYPDTIKVTVLVSFLSARNQKQRHQSKVDSLWYCCCYGGRSLGKRTVQRSFEHHDNSNRNNIILGVDCQEIGDDANTNGSNAIDLPSTSSTAPSTAPPPSSPSSSSIWPSCLIGYCRKKPKDDKGLQRTPMRRLKLSHVALDQYINENFFFGPKLVVQRFFRKGVTMEEHVFGYSIAIYKSDIDDDDRASGEYNEISTKEGAANEQEYEDDVYLFIPYSSTYHSKFVHWLLDNPLGWALHRRSNPLEKVYILPDPIPTAHHHHLHYQYGHGENMPEPDFADEI